MEYITLDKQVTEDKEKVKSIIRSPSESKFLEKGNNLYSKVREYLTEDTRVTTEQIGYLNAFETALSVFRSASSELRKKMDVLSLEQKIHVRTDTVNDLAGTEKNIEDDELYRRFASEVMYSNRYALKFAGEVGLAMLESDKPETENIWNFGTEYEASQDPDILTILLAGDAPNDFDRVIQDKLSAGTLPEDKDLKHSLEATFASWINQYSKSTHEEVIERHDLSNTGLEFDGYRMKNGIFNTSKSNIIVDDRFMKHTKEDIIGNTDFVESIEKAIIMVMAYNPELGINPAPVPKSAAIIGPPGCGKTFTVHGLIQTAMEEARRRNLNGRVDLHSVTDYSSTYQNATSLALMEMVMSIRNYPGFNIMYMADMDTLFRSRNSPNASPEEQKTTGVYFKMFDGSLIPKGKFLPIGDANFIHGMDSASKDRLFGLTIEMGRFKTSEEYSEYVRRTLTRGSSKEILAPSEWNEIGGYLLNDTELSNRSIGHVVDQLRGGFEVDYDYLGLTFNQQKQHIKAHLESFNKDQILDSFTEYVATRERLEDESLKTAGDEAYKQYKMNVDAQDKYNKEKLTLKLKSLGLTEEELRGAVENMSKEADNELQND